MGDVKYFKALVQVVMSNQPSLFEELPEREEMLRSIFEKGIFIPQGEIDKKIGWGIGSTRFVNDENWIFGILHKVISSDTSILPFNANSLEELQHVPGNVVNKAPFFFNFAEQHLYTQSHWQICRASKSASKTWKNILLFALSKHIFSLDVQSIPEEASFWEQMNKVDRINNAQFELYGPNILNDERIRSLISEFNPTETDGLIITLKNYIKGLKTDAEEFISLLKYILRGGGRGEFKGVDKSTGKSISFKTDSNLATYIASNTLDKTSSDMEISKVLNEILRQENTN